MYMMRETHVLKEKCYTLWATTDAYLFKIATFYTKIPQDLIDSHEKWLSILRESELILPSSPYTRSFSLYKCATIIFPKMMKEHVENNACFHDPQRFWDKYIELNQFGSRSQKKQAITVDKTRQNEKVTHFLLLLAILSFFMFSYSSASVTHTHTHTQQQQKRRKCNSRH